MKRLSKTEDNALSLYVGLMTFAGCCVFASDIPAVQSLGWLVAIVSSAVICLSGMAERILHKLTTKSR